MIRFLNIRAIVAGFLGLLCFVFVIGIGKNLYQQYVLHGQFAEMQNATQQLQKNNEGISQMIQSFQQESTIELEGRKDLNLQKPGEQAVIIIPPKNYPQDAKGVSSAPTHQTSFAAQEQNSPSGQIVHRAQLWWEFVFH